MHIIEELCEGACGVGGGKDGGVCEQEVSQSNFLFLFSSKELMRLHSPLSIIS